jgi:hypothetical protein
VPERFIVKPGVFAAFDWIVKLPLKFPVDIGEKLTIMVHICPGFLVMPFTQLPPIRENGAAGFPMELMVSAAVPVFLTMIV